MKKRLVTMLLSIILLMTAGCQAAESQPQETPTESTTVEENPSENDLPEEPVEETEEEGDYVTTGGIPWINSDIKENITADMEISPKDDFHLYANKEWILNNEIPEGYSSWSHYRERGLEVKKQCMDLLKDETLEGHDAELIQTYNKLILDWDARNALGVTELQDTYDALMAIESIEDLNRIYTDSETAREFYDGISYGATTGLNNPETYICYVGTPDLILGDSAEYSERTEYGDMTYGYRKDLFVYIAGRMGMSEADAEQCFDNAIDFDAKLAGIIYTTEDEYSDDYYDKINNEMSYDDLIALTENYPLDAILTATGYKYDGIYWVSQPEYFAVLESVYNDENAEAIKDRMIVSYLLGYASCLDRETYDKNNELYNSYFGTSGTVSDEEMAYNKVTGMLPASMQKVYISKYGSEEDKKRMEELCQQVIDTYRELLSENEWASDETRDYAVEKLDSIVIHAAYPDKFRDTSDIDISGCTLIEANDVLADREIAYNVKLLGTKYDEEMWAEDFDILSCNAFYSPTDNTINMIIGMMGEPFYSSDMSTEELYASIGAFWVGHEVSHAFDSSGAQFDAEGKYRDWWTAEDKAEFDRRVKKMDDYLDGIVAFGDYHFKGANIDTEMVADMTGLQCALRMAEKVDGFDYDKFFVKYAQMNASLGVYSDELYMLQQDAHPLDYSRTNVPVQQFEEFYETYDIKEGDNMYLAPEDRLIVW